jgi:hypothetical protein
MKFLKNILKKLRKAIPIKPEYDGSEWDFERYGCPDCSGHEFLEGPSGGACTNICCANSICQNAFNVGPFMQVQRISNRHFASYFVHKDGFIARENS